MGVLRIDIESLLRDIIESKRSDTETRSELLESFDKLAGTVIEEKESVDIYNADELVYYALGNTIHENLKANLKGIREFVDKYREDVTAEYAKFASMEEAVKDEDKGYLRKEI